MVIFRAVDGSWTSGEPLKLGEFSGAIASLDLLGNYVGKIHLLGNGVQLGELDTWSDGNGNTGTLATQKPFWTVEGNDGYTSPLKNLYKDEGSSWHVSNGNHSITWGFTPIASSPAGGGSVTGPPNTNPLDNHFQNLLSNPLYTLEEYLYSHDIDAGVFDFLSTPAKITLANTLQSIDLLNDFLQSNGSSSAAQDLVAEMLAEVALYNSTSLSMDDLNSLLASLPLLDQVVVAIGPDEPGISPTNPICAQMFDFHYTSPSNVLRAGGILNLKVVLPVNGVNTNFPFPTILFETSPPGSLGCVSINQKAANAINAAVASTIQRITNNNLYGIGTTATESRVRSTYFAELNRNFSLEVTQCGGTSITLTSMVSLLGVGLAEDNNRMYGTIFRDFFTDFAILCH